MIIYLIVLGCFLSIDTIKNNIYLDQAESFKFPVRFLRIFIIYKSTSKPMRETRSVSDIDKSTHAYYESLYVTILERDI